MMRIGKTYGNLMVDVQTGSEKLKDRARRILTIVTGLDYDEADKLLKRAHWNVKAAIVMQKTGVPYRQALSRLRNADDSCAKRSAKTSNLACATSWRTLSKSARNSPPRLTPSQLVWYVLLLSTFLCLLLCVLVSPAGYTFALPSRSASRRPRWRWRSPARTRSESCPKCAPSG